MAQDRHVITVIETIVVAATPEALFDYTQDFTKRPEWDAAIVEAAAVGDAPRAVRIRIRGLGSATVVYQLDRRPERTSAAFTDVRSAWMTGGGGSWQYEPIAGGTRWQQTNSLELKWPRLARLLAPLIERSLRRSTRSSMAEAKRRLEAARSA